MWTCIHTCSIQCMQRGINRAQTCRTINLCIRTGETIDMSEEEFLYLEGSNNVQSFVHFPCSRIIKQEDVNPIKMQQKGMSWCAFLYCIRVYSGGDRIIHMAVRKVPFYTFTHTLCTPALIGGGNMHIVMVIQEALEEINFKNHLPKTFEFLSSIDGRSVHFKVHAYT